MSTVRVVFVTGVLCWDGMAWFERTEELPFAPRGGDRLTLCDYCGEGVLDWARYDLKDGQFVAAFGSPDRRDSTVKAVVSAMTDHGWTEDADDRETWDEEESHRIWAGKLRPVT